jgi:L-histidine Nalpha-methyltransferase
MSAPQLLPVPEYATEVVEGLFSWPKHLPCKLFYDDRGSALFEEITRLPEYYLTRIELEILQERSPEIAQAAGSPISLVELGAGTATKTGTLIRAFARRQMRTRFFPVDISASALSLARKRIKEQCPGVFVRSVIADFANGYGFLRQIVEPKLVLYLGSSIGNFNWNESVEMLSGVGKQLAPGDALLLGTDMVKNPEILIPAYDDAQGVTAEFNKNILVRLNRELSADFDLNSFRHIAEWNSARSRMEIFLESTRPQTVSLRSAGVQVRFAAGERIHTENSHKYTLERITSLLCVSGFRLEKSWFDRRRWFGLHFARV